MNSQTDEQTYVWIDRWPDEQMDTETDGQMDKPMDGHFTSLLMKGYTTQTIQQTIFTWLKHTYIYTHT